MKKEIKGIIKMLCEKCGELMYWCTARLAFVCPKCGGYKGGINYV